MQTEIETDAIVLQVMSGHREAFGELVERYQVDVWRVLVAVLNDGAVTEDLVQQTFVNAFEHLDQYQPGRDFGLWIKTIARNLALAKCCLAATLSLNQPSLVTLTMTCG
ncbi:MAG: RNA polymerase sigma factor, partial [Verrucomicrobiaceae bacterium]